MRAAATALRVSVALAVPGGLMVLAAILCLGLRPLPDSWSDLLQAYPYLTLATGVSLGLRFRQGRLVVAVVALALADRMLLASGSDAVLHGAVAFLLPSMLVVLGTWPERGGVSMVGVSALALVALTVLIVVQPEYRHAARVLEHPHALASLAEILQVPPAAAVAFASGLGVLALLFVRRRGALDAGFFWSLIAVLLALGRRPHDLLASAYLATAELVLAGAIIERSYALAYRDELTGLPARRALNEALSGRGGLGTIAVVDVDHFKTFNDRHGHAVGDQVLRMIARQLARVGGGGHAYRYGGEEFVVLFRRRALGDAIEHLEALRKSISEASFVIRSPDRPTRKPRQPVPSGRRSVRVTVSVGAADSGDRNRSADEVLQAADRALYRAKRAGRNQVRT